MFYNMLSSGNSSAIGVADNLTCVKKVACGELLARITLGCTRLGCWNGCTEKVFSTIDPVLQESSTGAKQDTYGDGC